MKKIITSGFVLASLIAQAQEGKVGVNTNVPKATLDVQMKSTNQNGTTNEGIIAPKLTKDRVAKIAASELTEGTLVYVEDVTYTPGADTAVEARVAKITEKGYYFYNGTEWVKSGVGENDQEWVYDGNTGKVYLKKAQNSDGGERSYYYGSDFVQQRNYIKQRPYFHSDELKTSFMDTYSTSNVFSLNTPGANVFTSQRGMLKLLPEHHDTSVVKEDYRDYVAFLQSIHSDNSFVSLDKGNVTAGTFIASAGLYQGNSVPDTQQMSPMTGQNIRFIRGLRVSAESYTSGEINDMNGMTTFLKNRSTGTVKSFTANGTHIVNNGTMIDGFGSYVGYRAYPGSTLSGTLYLNISKYLAQGGTSGDKVVAIGTEIVPSGNAKIREAIGIEIKNTINVNSNTERNVGLYIHNIGNASNENYSIYTNTGAVRFGDLAGAGNRPVFADANGKLIIGDATNAATSFKWVEDAANTSVKLAVTSAGTERTTAPVSITDTGMVKATSFQGSNGATIFPDYVFQKYYDGVSDIKADYTFKSLDQVEDFVKVNGHLPGYKSASEIKKQGYIDIMETQLTNVEKIEELYLHSIEQDKVNKTQANELKAQAQEIETLRKENEDLKTRLSKLEQLWK